MGDVPFNVVDVDNIDVVQFLKTKWLQIGFVDDNQEAQIVSSLSNIFLTYSRSFQIPTLVTNLFCAIKEVVAEGSGGVYFNCGYVPSSVLSTFKKCIQLLPVQQTLKLWEQFLNDCKDFFLQSRPGASLQAGALISVQFFIAFAYEVNIINIFHSNKSTTQLLLQKTEKLVHLDSEILDLKDANNNNFQFACMLLIVAYRKLRSTYNSLPEISLADRFSDPCCSFHFLSSHDVLGCSIDICKPYLDANDKRISYCMLNMLMQKAVSILESYEEKNVINENKDLLKEIISVLTDHVISCMSADDDSSWNGNVNFLDANNYSVAAVSLYVTNMPNLIKFIDAKDLANFCSTVVSIMIRQRDSNSLSTSGISIKRLLSDFLCFIFLTESQAFETAFVTAIWDNIRPLLHGRKRVSSDSEIETSLTNVIFTSLCSSRHKWAKYAATTPKCSDDINSMWMMVKKISYHMNEILENPSKQVAGELKIPQTKQLLKIINYLPLRCLMPGNQMRCLFGLSLILFLLGNSCANGSVDVYLTLDEVLKALVGIFEGDRSIWLFDHVKAVPYLRAVLAVIKNLKSEGKSGNLKGVKTIFTCLFNLSTRNTDALLAMEEYAVELSSDIARNITCAEAFLCLLQRLTELLERPYLNPNSKEVCKRLVVQSCSYIAKYAKNSRNRQLDPEECFCLVGCYTMLLRLVVSQGAAALVQEKKDKWLKWLPYLTDLDLGAIEKSDVDTEIGIFLHFICEVVKQRKVLESFITEDICSKSWNTLKHVFGHKAEIAKKSLVSHLKQMGSCFVSESSFHHNVCMSQSETATSEEEAVASMMETACVCFTTEESNAISWVIQESTSGEFELIIQELYDAMGTGVPDIETMDASTFQVQLLIIQSVLEATVEENRLKSVSKLIQHCLTRLHFIMNQTCLSSRCLLSIILPCMSFISFILEKKREKVALPKQCAVQCLHSCLAIKLPSYVQQPVLFTQVYQSVWKVMSLLLSNYTYAVISSSPAFIPCVTMLLKSAVQIGSQELVLKCDPVTQCQIQLCANNLERLFTAMSKNENELSKIVPYVIADYVDMLQNITLHPSVKPYFVSGINRLLDMCSEESIKMLAVNVSFSCREIYINLVKNYKLYRGSRHF